MAPAAGAVPFGDMFVTPPGGLVVVAAVAGVGCTYFDTEIRSRYPKAMVCTVVNHHVRALWHMALDTFGAAAHNKQNLAIRRFDGFPFFAVFLVEMVCLGVISAGPMTLQAKCIALFDPFNAVHIMAIAAAYVAGVHLALGKGTVNVNLFEDLAVGKIQLRCKQTG